MDRPVCHGNGDDHCCYVDGKVCEFLEENTVPGRRWACGLLRRLESWAAVHEHPDYQKIKEHFASLGVSACGDWLGEIREDGTIVGQCCFEGYIFDADGNVIEGP